MFWFWWYILCLRMTGFFFKVRQVCYDLNRQDIYTHLRRSLWRGSGCPQPLFACCSPAGLALGRVWGEGVWPWLSCSPFCPPTPRNLPSSSTPVSAFLLSTCLQNRKRSDSMCIFTEIASGEITRWFRKIVDAVFEIPWKCDSPAKKQFQSNRTLSESLEISKDTTGSFNRNCLKCPPKAPRAASGSRAAGLCLGCRGEGGREVTNEAKGGKQL